jgi:hypothetical protein
MATIAVFIALGGTSYAISKLPKNSVGTKQLKKNAVATAKIQNEAITGDKIEKEVITGEKVKAGSLTGAQINASTLGTVPTADRATTANTADRATTASTAISVTPPEPWHEVGTPGEPQFQNGCENSSSMEQTVRFYKDHEGVVHLEGRYGSCDAKGDIVFQLPGGYRPGSTLQFAPPGLETATVVNSTVASVPKMSGGVSCYDSDCFLNGFTFRAES